MHRQIRYVIERLMFSPGEVLVELSAVQDTALGRLLYLLYYRTNLCDLLDPKTRYGYPHNGGQHTFTYKGPWKDAVAFLETMKEELEKFKLTPEESQVLSELSYISQEIIAARKKM